MSKIVFIPVGSRVNTATVSFDHGCENDVLNTIHSTLAMHGLNVEDDVTIHVRRDDGCIDVVFVSALSYDRVVNPKKKSWADMVEEEEDAAL